MDVVMVAARLKFNGGKILGRPEQFHDKEGIRIRSMERAITQYQFSAHALRQTFAHMLDEHTSSFLKGFGNELNLLAATRELFFASRELLDVYLGRLAAATAQTGSQTPRDCVPFMRRLIADDFANRDRPIFQFLKTNITYVFHIRKVRNELKANPALAEFNFNTDQFELRMLLPIRREEELLIPHLDIQNMLEAQTKKQYVAVFNLDILFPEMREFWGAFQTAFAESYPLLININLEAENL